MLNGGFARVGWRVVAEIMTLLAKGALRVAQAIMDFGVFLHRLAQSALLRG